MREIFAKINEIIKNAGGLFDLIIKLAEYFLFEHKYNKDDVPEEEEKKGDKVVKITE